MYIYIRELFIIYIEKYRHKCDPLLHMKKRQ